MKAARLYAQVLVDICSAPGSKTPLDSSVADLKKFEAVMIESPLLTKLLLSPTITDEEKQKIVGDFGSRLKLGALPLRFLSVLLKRNRMGILSEIFKEVEALQVEKSGGLVGELVSAVPLETGVVTGVEAALSKKLNRKVQLKQKVDPALIAGMRVTVSGVTYDGSIQNKIERLVGNFRQ